MKSFDYKNMIFIALLFLLAVASCIYNNVADYDIWMDIISGSIFINSLEIIKNDVFSYLPTIEWFNQNWGAGSIFYMLNLIGGTFFFRVLILFLTLFTIKKTIDLNEKEFKHSSFLYALFCFATLALTTLSAQIFSIFFFALWVYILENIKKDNYDFLWLIPFSSIFWVNTHNSGLLGISLLIIYIAATLFDEIKIKEKTLFQSLKTRQISSLLGTLVLSMLLMTFLNPYLWWTWTKSLNTLFITKAPSLSMQPFYLIQEFWSIGDAIIPIIIGYLAFVVLSVTILIKKHINKEKTDTTRFLLLILFLGLSLAHKCYGVYFAILSLGFLYPEIYQMFNSLKQNILSNVSKENKGPLKGVFAFFNFTIIATFIIYSLGSPLRSNLPLKVSPHGYPIQAAKFIKNNFMEGNIACPSYWGGYLAWELYPDNKISIDTRGLNVYTQEAYNNGLEFEYKGYYFENFLYKYPTDIIILDTKHFSFAELSRFARNWQYVYADKTAIVLVKQSQYKGVYTTPEWKDELFKIDLTKHFNL